jgi:hypothetical protein
LALLKFAEEEKVKQAISEEQLKELSEDSRAVLINWFNKLSPYFCPRCNTKTVALYSVNDSIETLVEYNCELCRLRYSVRHGQWQINVWEVDSAVKWIQYKPLLNIGQMIQFLEENLHWQYWGVIRQQNSPSQKSTWQATELVPEIPLISFELKYAKEDYELVDALWEAVKDAFLNIAWQEVKKLALPDNSSSQN